MNNLKEFKTNAEYSSYITSTSAKLPNVSLIDETNSVKYKKAGNVLGITLTDLVWVTDILSTGGTANKDNCTYKVIAQLKDGSSEDITSKAKVTGSLDVPETTATTKQKVGKLTLLAVYENFSSSKDVDVYQKGVMQFISFAAFSPQSVIIDNTGGNTPVLEYSYNKSAWTSWDYSELEFGTSDHNTLYLRGKNPSGFSKDVSSYSRFGFIQTGVTVNVGGNVMGLIDWEEAPADIPCDFCFQHLFFHCQILRIDENFLPATGLTKGCYKAMFSVCSAMTNMPLLLATELKEGCYGQMFEGCYGLTTIQSALPATVLARSCYGNMFSSCNGLMTIPETLLPATALTDYCYEGMFKYCERLSGVPAGFLPATILAESCYYQMFRGCTMLLDGKVNLFATALTKSCYDNMFASCITMTFAPSLPATELSPYCYNGMFRGCKNLSNVPDLPASAVVDSCYQYMFDGCTSMTKAPDLPAKTMVKGCYFSMFYGCSNLKEVHCDAEEQILEADHCTSSWLSGVASTGDFYSKSGAWTTGSTSGIPTGWTNHRS